MTTINSTNSLLLILTWNANGLKQNKDELIFLLQDKNIDIALISEMHFTPNSCINIYGYKAYFACHPDGTSHAGAAIYIKSNLSHHPLPPYIFPHIQASGISIITQNNIPINISSVYSLPGIGINIGQFSDYFSTLGHRFISGGDFNAKHPKWGNRSPNTRGRVLLNCITNHNLSTLAPLILLIGPPIIADYPTSWTFLFTNCQVIFTAL